MAYEKRISRRNPGLIVVVVDDSPSQGDPLPGTGDAKFKWVERYFGLILKELLARSTEFKGDATVIKPRYFFYIIIYGGNAQPWGQGEMDIEKVVEKYAADGNSLGLGGHIPATDTHNAFEMAFDYLRGAVQDERFKDSFPPMLLHLTDGESQTDAVPIARQIMDLRVSDGNVLILNAYIGTHTDLNYGGPDDFSGYATQADVGTSQDNLRLFEMSSVVPESIRANLIEDGIFPQLREDARLFFDVRTKDMLKHAIQSVGSIGSRAEKLLR